MSLTCDLKKLKEYKISDLKNLCDDIRKDIISAVSVNGGHLASNLGTVELTVALDYVFDCPSDKIIFDVGHQCYTHKILTGRSLDNLRKSNGISGFPKCEESKYDCFNTGHASTALSAACGFMRANKLNGRTGKVISVIGDGSFGGGESFEALNDMNQIDYGCLIVLNDNEYTIDKTQGVIASSEENLKNYLNSKVLILSSLFVVFIYIFFLLLLNNLYLIFHLQLSNHIEIIFYNNSLHLYHML